MKTFSNTLNKNDFYNSQNKIVEKKIFVPKYITEIKTDTITIEVIKEKTGKYHDEMSLEESIKGGYVTKFSEFYAQN